MNAEGGGTITPLTWSLLSLLQYVSGSALELSGSAFYSVQLLLSQSSRYFNILLNLYMVK